jgi:hypothetical protein
VYPQIAVTREGCMMSAFAIQRLFRRCDELSIAADLDPEDDLMDHTPAFRVPLLLRGYDAKNGNILPDLLRFDSGGDPIHASTASGA